MAIAYGLTKTKKVGETPIVTQVAEEEPKEAVKGGFLGGLGYLGEKFASSAVQSVEGAVDYIGAGVNKIFGNDKRAEEIIANDWFGDWYTGIDEKYNPNQVMQVAGDVASGIGTSAPSMLIVAALTAAAAGLTALAPATGGTSAAGAAGAAVSTAASAAAGVAKTAQAVSTLAKIAKGVKVAAKVAQVAQPVIAGLGAAGTATKEAYQQTGELSGKEFGYGAGVGAIEGGLEAAGNLLGAGSGAVMKRITGKAAQSVTKTGIVKSTLKNFGSEAIEEGLSEFLNPYVARATYDPNAENASFGEIAYASFIGGVSGSIFGSVDTSVGAISNRISGGKLAGQEGMVMQTLRNAEMLMDESSAFPTTAETRATLRKIYNEVKMTSDQAGAMPSLGFNQKGALGALNTYSTAAVLNGLSINTANDIISNPARYIDRFNSLGYVDANGNPMQFTVEGLLKGLEGVQGLDGKARSEAIAKALRSNPLLRVASVASVAGTMSLNPDSFVESVFERGFTGMTAEDIDRFAKEASDEQRATVQEMLGIPDLRMISAEEFAARAAEVKQMGGAKYYQERKAFVSEMESLKGKTARKIPKGITIADGSVVHYKDVDADIAVKRTGDTYSIYDYDSKVTLRGLSKAAVNSLLQEYRANADAKVDTETNTEQKPKKIVDENYENADIPDKHMSIDEAMQKDGITRLQKKSLKILKKVAKALDVKMRIYESPLVEQKDKNGNIVKDKDGNPIMVRKGANGMFDPNTDTIYIDLYASVDGKGTMLYTASHELTHFVKKWNEAEFEIFKEFLEKHYLKSGQSFNQLARIKMREARADKRSITFEVAMEEVVADTCEKMLSDPDVVQKLTTEKKTHFKMVSKVVNWLKTTWQKLTNMYHGVAPDSYEANYFSAMEEAYDNVKGMWVDLVKGAKANYQAAEGSRYTSKMLDVLEQGRKSAEQSHFVEDKYFKSQMSKWQDLKHGSFVKVGVIEKGHPLSAVGMPAGVLRYDVDKLKRNMADHSDYLSIKILNSIPDIIADPMAISEYSKENTVSVFGNVFVNNSPMMVGITISKDRAGNDINKVRTFNARRDVGNLITDDTVLYINEDKRKTRKWFQACGIQVPLGETKFGFIRSISQKSESVKSGKAEVLQSARNKAYMDAVTSGDMDTAQRMVEEAAKANGYSRKMWHETDAQNIHVFDVSLNTHGGTDSETPYGIFTKSTDKSIGLGSRQMPLYVKAEKTLYVKDREDVKNKIPALVPFFNRIAEIDKKYDALSEKYEDEQFDALGEWMDEHPDADMDVIFPTSYIIEHKPADIDSEKYLAAFERYEKNRAEWESEYNKVAVQTKKMITSYLRKNGYDSMYFELDGGSRGRQTDSLILLDSNQVKSAETITYDDNGDIIPLSNRFDSAKSDIRYSNRVKQDSEGNELSEGQQEYFKDSKQLDSEGRLQVMYQGAAEEFYTFDKKKSKASNLYGRGFYFTNSADQARHYGKVRGYYLNIKNPLSTTQKTISRIQMRKFLNAVAENEDYGIENYGTYDVEKVLNSVYNGDGKTDFAMLNDVSLTAIGDLVEAVQLFNEINGTAYDGFILDTESVTFTSEQAKLTTNTSPTSSTDIRYSSRSTDSMKDSVLNEGQVLYSESDSDGNELSAEQQEFFKDSKVRDEKGRLLAVYHGTEKGGFTIFTNSHSGEAYWFADKTTAESYIDRSAIGEKHWSGKGVTSLYSVYLNAKNPLVIDAEGYRAVSIPTDIFESDGRKRMRHIDDIAMYAKENGYDGLIVKNVRDYGMYMEENLGEAYDYNLPEGTVYAVFDPSQVKDIANKTPTSDPDIRYSSRSTYSHEGLTEADIASADKIVKRLRELTIAARLGIRKFASYTDERMEQEIQNASSETEMDYAKSYIAWVTTEDFIAATTMTEESRERIKTEAGKLDLEKLQKQKQPIYLHVDFSTGEIVGHEGRHRMLALQDAGISRVAVVIDATNDNRKHTKPIEIKWLGGQNFKYAKGLGFYLHDAIPLSKRYADVAKEMFAFDSKEGVKFQGRSKQTVDFMPEEEYNSYGWVRENDVLTSAQYKDFESKFAKALNGDSYHKTASGEYMIPVSHKGDGVLDGVEYTIVYAKGSIEMPEITRILEIDENDETNLSRIRSQVYAIEQQGVRKKSDGIFTSYTPSDFQSYESAKRRALSAVRNSRGVGLYGGTGSAKTARSAGGVQQQKITGFTNNEDGSQTRFYSDGTSEIKRSDRVSLKKKLYALQDEIHDIKLSDGYNAVIQKVMDAETLAEKKAARAEYDAWEEETHFTEKVREAKAIEEELNAMIKAEEEEAKQKAVAEQSKKIAESGLSEADYFRSEAVKEFGYTPYYNDAGYILPDGRMLNFSGEKGKHFGKRTQDHRAIGMVYADTKGSKALTRFMNDGNVRLMYESPGIDLGTKEAPTPSQYNTIARFISEAKRKGRFYVDFTDANGHLAGSMEYNGRNVDASVIVDDIKYFFRNGEVRERIDYYDPLYQTRKTYTAGQYQKAIASKSKARIYSKGASIELMKRITMGTKLTQETLNDMTDAIWEYLNKEQDDPMGRDAVAENLADVILEKMLMEGETPNANVNEAKERLSMLRTGIRRLDIRDRYKGDLKFVLDKDGYRKFMARWGLKQNVDKGAYPMDLFVTDIAREVPGLAYLEEMETSDAMLEIDKLYDKAMEEADTKYVNFIDVLSGEEVDTLRKEIANTLKMAFDDEKVRYDKTAFVDEVGTALEAIDSKLVWKYAEHEYKYGYPKAVNRVIYAANKIKDIKTRKYKNASEQTTSAFEHLNKSLGSIVLGSNLRSAEHIRLVMADVLKWYNNRGNEVLYTENAMGEQVSLYDSHVADMLSRIVDAQGQKFTVKELKMVHDVLMYFANFEQRWRKVYRDGKWVDAMPVAQKYYDTMQTAGAILRKNVLLRAGTGYMKTFSDPASVARRFDAYQDGFFTEMHENIRQGAKDAAIAEMDVMREYDEFLKKNKSYLEKATNEVVEFRGHKIPRITLISLYMTLKRQQAMRGIIENGFRYSVDDKHVYKIGERTRRDTVVTVQGFAKGQVLSDEALEQTAATIRSEIEKNFSDLDKKYIKILENSYNVELRSMKEYRDIQRMGISNVSDGYYYPIRRDLPAKNVDAKSYMDDLDTVSNASFNKDIVKGAKQALYIDSADMVYRRHAKSVCKYTYLSPAIEQFNTLYGLAVNEDSNAANSIATAARNTWKGGFEFFAKMIKDIEGVRTEELEASALSAIRSGYAVSVLAANLKVLPTQLSSIFASLSILDYDCLAKGIIGSAKDVDTYCRLAELRAYENTAAKAQALASETHVSVSKGVAKTQKVGEVLMTPIGTVDRFVVCRLFGACQVQAQKNGDGKIGTVENKVAAGKLLEKVIFETQQNTLMTEKSAAMRAGQILKALTMFSSDAMKVVGRVIDGYGEIVSITTQMKMGGDKAQLKIRLRAAWKKELKAVLAMFLNCVWMTAVARLFSHIYNKDEQDSPIWKLIGAEDESEPHVMKIAIDMINGMVSGLPVVRDVMSFITDGFEPEDMTYSAVNDLMSSVSSLVKGIAGGTSADMMRAMRQLTYSVSAFLGIPSRNLYNAVYGFTKRFNEPAAYRMDEIFNDKNYRSDFYKAIDDGNNQMADYLLGLAVGERIGEKLDKDVFNELLRLSKEGRKIMPKEVPTKITIDGEERILTPEEQATIQEKIFGCNDALSAMMSTARYQYYDEETKEKAVNYVFDLYRDKAIYETIGVRRMGDSALLGAISANTLSYLYIKTDGEHTRANVVGTILKTNCNANQKLLLIYAKGYSLKDGEINGISANEAKERLAKYINTLKISKARKMELAQKCGFKVQNGKIILK